jgi:hypothetical protein
VRTGWPGRLVGGAGFLNGFIEIERMTRSSVLENKRDFCLVCLVSVSARVVTGYK